MSSATRKAGVTAAILAASGAVVTVGSIQVAASAESAYATTGVNIRSGPGTKYRVVGGLNRGQKITAVGHQKHGWSKVRFNGQRAYVAAKYLGARTKKGTGTSDKVYTKGTKVATAALHVRNGPGLGHKNIGYIADGQNVTLTGKQSHGFVEVLYGGKRAWVSSQYLVSSMSSLPKDTGARVTTADLMIRTTPNANFKIITTAKKGTELQATGATRNGYAQIVYHHAIRWVAAKHLTNKNVAGPSGPSTTHAGSAKKAPVKKASAKNVSAKKASAKKASTTKTTPTHRTKSAAHAKTSPQRSASDKSAPKTKTAPKTKAASVKVKKTHRASTRSVPRTVGNRYATTPLLVRTTPGSDFKTTTNLAKGSPVKITGKTKNGKAQIVRNGSSRWVTARYLAGHKPKRHHSAGGGAASTATAHHTSPTQHKAKPADAPKRTTTPKATGSRYATTKLALRNAPSGHSGQSGVVQAGTKLKITGATKHGKTRILHNGTTRWVTAQYLVKHKPHKSSTSSTSSASSSSSSSSGTSSQSGPPAKAASSHQNSAPSAGSKGQAALQYAKKQLGKPYVFGAAGPDTFDCSGLTMQAWKSAAGVNLPHSTTLQFNKGPRVSMNNLKPGDIVFFYPKKGVSHNGIYAGNGKVINAPRPGKDVRYASISSMPVAGATRPA